MAPSTTALLAMSLLKVRLPFSLSLSFLLFAAHLVGAADYEAADKIFLNCGGPPDATSSFDGRKWTTDIGSKFTSSSGSSTTSPAATQDPAIPEVPYMNARVFRSPFTYTFPVSPGRKFLRLHFYPDSYAGLNASDARFSVTTQSYTLLRNFSASETALGLNYDYIVKEYSIHVKEKNLSVTFTPFNPHYYAFVNGIEVVSVPDIYASKTTLIVGTTTPSTIDNTTALENLYRLNVGGNDISPSHDTGLFRSWNDDVRFLYGAAFGVTASADVDVHIQYPPGTPSFIAPLDVYATARSMGPNASVNLNYNLTWILSVDPGFSYLVRLHFCEGANVINRVNQRVFDVFLHNQTAEEGVDVIAWAQKFGVAYSNGVPVHKDYVVLVPNGEPRQDLWLSLHPYTSSKPEYYDAILNGVEVFKINDTEGSLAGANPAPLNTIDEVKVRVRASTHGNGNGTRTIAVAFGVTGGAALVLLLVGMFAFVVRRHGKEFSEGTSRCSANTIGSCAPSLPLNLCRHFSFAEIKVATNDFDEALLLGVGGFGKVYKGEIDGGSETTKVVAIKRGNPLSEQGVDEFQTEIEMLSKLRHRNLVSLIGYCEENTEMILVYDYMAYGTLREHLYKTQKPPLPWKQRLEICIGAARGLHYLHTGAKHTIIHRDVKTTNILLDDKWVAKVSDFGLSKTGPALDYTHVSTTVKGSFGYLDPEYFMTQQLTEKSDVYSFGVVLFETLCARPALNPTLADEEQVSLAEWATHCYKNGILDQIIDPYLKGKIAPECFAKFAETAIKCVADEGIERPSMGDVLWNLEFALQLQLQESGTGKGMMQGEEESLYTDSEGKKDSDVDALPGFDGNVTNSRSSGMSMSIGGRSVANDDSDGLPPSTVFSQVMNPEGC